MVLSHDFPTDKGPPDLIPAGLVALSDRLASASGWRVVACCLRGVGDSEGDFSLGGWLDDLAAVVAKVSAASVAGGAWVVGAGVSGSLAISLGASDTKVRGVACLAAPATFSDWVADPGSVAARAREVGVITTPGEPSDLERWAGPFSKVRPSEEAGRLSGRPVLVLHGADDDVVPVDDARMIAQAVGESAELRVLAGAGHRLNSDPRDRAATWLARAAEDLISTDRVPC